MCALLSLLYIFNQLRPVFKYGIHSLILLLTLHTHSHTHTHTHKNNFRFLIFINAFCMYVKELQFCLLLCMGVKHGRSH
jgi:hypothetical protein